MPSGLLEQLMNNLIIERQISSSKFNFFVGFKGRIFSSLDHADAITSNNPFLPILCQVLLLSLHCALPEFANCHMGVEVLVCLKLRDRIRDDRVDILQLIAVGFRVKEDRPVREAVQSPEDDVEGREVVEPFLEDLVGLVEERSINKGKAEVNVWLPPHKGRIVLLSQGLDLLIVLLNCKSQSSVSGKFQIVNCFHDGLSIRICVYYFFYKVCIQAELLQSFLNILLREILIRLANFISTAKDRTFLILLRKPKETRWLNNIRLIRWFKQELIENHWIFFCSMMLVIFSSPWSKYPFSLAKTAPPIMKSRRKNLESKLANIFSTSEQAIKRNASRSSFFLRLLSSSSQRSCWN